MKKREVLSRRVVFVLCAGLVFAAASVLPGSARATCSESKVPCVRLKAGKVVKKGRCDAVSCARLFRYDFSGGSMSSEYVCPAPDGWTGEKDDDGCANVAHLDGKPATWQEKPVMGKGWSCLAKTGTKEVMCAKDE